MLHSKNWNPRFNDSEDPEKPVRFVWYYKAFDDEYVLWDKETNTKVILTKEFLQSSKRHSHETDTQFIIRVVTEGLKEGSLHRTTPPTKFLCPPERK